MFIDVNKIDRYTYITSFIYLPPTLLAYQYTHFKQPLYDKLPQVLHINLVANTHLILI